MWKEKSVKRAMALCLVILITGIIFYALRKYLNAFLGAFILFVIFRPMHDWLVNKIKFNRSLSAILVIFVSVVVFLIPLSLLISVIYQELENILPQIIYWAEHNIWLNQLWQTVGQTDAITAQLTKAGPAAKNFFFGTLSMVSVQVITAVIMYFLFYFLLVTEDKKLKKFIYSIVPFSDSNTIRLAHEFRKITYATLLTSGLIALIQGSLVTIGFLIFKIPGAFFWGFAATLLAFVPFLGTPSVWVPAVIYLLVNDRLLAGSIFFVWGLFISTIDNFLRPVIQKRVGQIHPLQSLIGIFVGFSLFGLIGIVLGPLLISYFILTVQMFKEEYIQ